MTMPKARLVLTTIALLAGAPAVTAPADDLDRLYRDFRDGAYARARAGALAYLAANGPRYSAAFVAAAAACKLHPHRGTNRQPFDQLRADYFVSAAASVEIQNWIGMCTSQPPPPPSPSQDGVGVSTSALSSDPASSTARPSRNEPAPKRPRISTPPVATSLPVGPAASTTGPATMASDRCLQGFVWREAFAGDHVCVTPATRAAAAADNAAAAGRIDPAGAYGPRSCRPGYVWRAARADDLVCVAPERRSAAAQDNA